MSFCVFLGENGLIFFNLKIFVRLSGRFFLIFSSTFFSFVWLNNFKNHIKIGRNLNIFNGCHRYLRNSTINIAYGPLRQITLPKWRWLRNIFFAPLQAIFNIIHLRCNNTFFREQHWSYDIIFASRNLNGNIYFFRNSVYIQI